MFIKIKTIIWIQKKNLYRYVTIVFKIVRNTIHYEDGFEPKNHLWLPKQTNYYTLLNKLTLKSLKFNLRNLEILSEKPQMKSVF